MKKRTFLKGLCLTLATSLLAAVMPMTAMAADEKTITVEFDTYIERGKTDDFSKNTTLKIQDNNNNSYDREALMGFDLSKVSAPSGKQIDTAKLKVNFYGFYNSRTGDKTYNAADVSVYAMGNVDYAAYETTAATWANTYSDTKQKVSTTTICPENVFTRGDSYEFDLTSYLAGKTVLTDKEMFAIFPDLASISGDIYSMEEQEGALAATLTVTYTDYIAPNYQVIKANADTYIEQNNNKTDPAGSNYQNFSSKEQMLFQRNGNWAREAMVRFPMDEIEIPAGKQIDTAVVTMYLETFYNNNATINNGNKQTAAPINMYTIKSQNYNPSTVTWVNAPGPVRGGSIAVTTLCPDNTLNKGGAYTFDISDYISTKTDFSGNETFVFYPEAYNNVSGSFYSMEAAGGIYTPELKVTFKDREDQTIVAFDSAYIREDDKVNADGTLNIVNNGDQTYPIQNIGDSKYNRIGFYMFDLGEIEVPAGKIITEATLMLYATMNYEKKPVDMRIYNISDDNWTSDSLSADTDVVDGANVVVTRSWDKVPYAEKIRTCLGIEAGISDVSTIPYVDTTTINQWIDFDVTEFVANQYNEDVDMLASFAAFPETTRKTGAVNIASVNYAGCEPKLFVKFGDASDITFGTPVFHGSFTATTVDTVKSKGRSGITIPVDGASDEPTEVNVYVAQYEEGTDNLVGVSLYRNMNIYSAKDGITFGYYPVGSAKQCYVKAFVWDANGGAYLGATDIAMEAPVVEEE